MSRGDKAVGIPPKTWSRLKPSKQDSLESTGLPSKGDESLLNSRKQERFYSDILRRCLHLGGTGVEDAPLDHGFRTLSLSDGEPKPSLPLPESAQETLALDGLYNRKTEDCTDVSVILQAMRKLREAIVATGRTDDFAQNVYLFIIRASILLRHMESYHPALLHLVNKIHIKCPLSKTTLQEMLCYHILDLACRQRDLNAAYRIRSKHGLRDSKVDGLLNAIVHGEWLAFWNTHSLMDRYQRCLTEPAYAKMRRHTLDCVGKSYLSIERSYLEKATNGAWDELKRDYPTTWQIEGELVTIRQIKRK